jgi:hypothetical protein
MHCFLLIFCGDTSDTELINQAFSFFEEVILTPSLSALPNNQALDDMTVCNWHTDELHVAKLLAVKRTVVIVSKWPTPAGRLNVNLSLAKVCFQVIG